MLKIKLQQQPESNTWYRVKINGEIIDHGVLQDTEETLCYKGLNFSNSTRTFVSISCPHDRELVVKELHMYDSRVIVGNTWDTDQIASAASADISDVINGNFDSIVMSSSVGGNKEWPPSGYRSALPKSLALMFLPPDWKAPASTYRPEKTGPVYR